VTHAGAPVVFSSSAGSQADGPVVTEGGRVYPHITISPSTTVTA